jgi:hypothetical protein
MKFNSTFKIFELNLRIRIQFKLQVMSFNISITINIIFTKSSIFFHHFIVIDIACSKHIAPKFCNNISPLQNYTLFEHKESTFLVLQTCPHGWTKGIYIYPPCKDTPFYLRCALGMAHSHVWPTFGFMVYPSTTPCFGNANVLGPLPTVTVISKQEPYHKKVAVGKILNFGSPLLINKSEYIYIHSYYCLGDGGGEVGQVCMDGILKIVCVLHIFPLCFSSSQCVPHSTTHFIAYSLPQSSPFSPL